MGMTKKELQEATTYRVREDFNIDGVYRVSKMIMDVEAEFYNVTMKEGTAPFCDCPGFVRQKFDPLKHKHLRVVRDYLSRGAPDWADYRFKGAGKNTKIRFVGASNE